MTQRIYGGSDDLIELVGDVYDEYDHHGLTEAEPALIDVELADGPVVRLKAWYGALPGDDSDGGWCIRIDEITTTTGWASQHDVDLDDLVHHHAARGEDEKDDVHGCPGYSEMVHVDAEVSKVTIRHGGAHGDDMQWVGLP